jgi:hypothetical protein
LGLVYVVTAQSGLALLVGLAGGLWAIAAQTLMLVVGGGLMFLSAGHDDQRPWATVWAVLGAVGLVGAPVTLGFVGVGELYRGLLGAGNWLVLIGVCLGQSLLLAGCLRVVFWPVQPAEGTRWVELISRLGLSSLALLAVVVPAFSTPLAENIGAVATTGLWGWAGTTSLLPLGLVSVSLGLGFGVWRMAEQFTGPTLGVGDFLKNLVRLDWAYRGVWVGVRGLSSLVQTVAEVLEGEGAMLWALVVVLVLWLVTQAG